MLVIAVMYPAGGDAHFDHGYYMATHMPLVRRLWNPMGLQSDQVLRGRPGLDGAPPAHIVMTLMNFDSVDRFKAAVAQHGAEIFADVPKFTAITPVMLLSEPAA